jgi:hypothetical protein
VVKKPKGIKNTILNDGIKKKKPKIKKRGKKLLLHDKKYENQFTINLILKTNIK